MLETILTSAVLYASTAIDLLVILMLLFSQHSSKQERRQIYLGQYIGSYTLIGISLIFAFILHYVPEKWLLGLLGLIPIYFGIKAVLGSENEAAAAQKKMTARSGKNLSATVALITVASCGADNIGLFVPYFVTLNPVQIGIVLIVFTICIYLLVWISTHCAQFKPIHRVLAKYGDWIMAVVYIGLGLMILWESGTIQHFTH
ncbi:CadD family cadmium resistance transporter [Lactobacillus selangorensis]|uniref:CadD family cadmium resistance transporter n=1 Tax=Lactobacillus selangorensis TaxID=81857 RepID=UPI0009EA1D4A|nr:CadD family cadmium resistance transporter [Lactobacillus selangorensis]